MESFFHLPAGGAGTKKPLRSGLLTSQHTPTAASACAIGVISPAWAVKGGTPSPPTKYDLPSRSKESKSMPPNIEPPVPAGAGHHEGPRVRGSLADLKMNDRVTKSRCGAMVPWDSGRGVIMNIHVIGTVFVGLLLSGCTLPSWDSMTSYVGLGSTEQAEPSRAASTEAEAAPSPTPAAQGALTDDWCQRAAKTSSVDAANNGFDRRTQRRRAEATYRQCLASSGSAAR